MRRFPHGAIPLLALFALSACSLFTSNTKPLPGLKAVAGMKTLLPRWHIDIGDGGKVPLSPALSGGTVYFARSTGDVEAVDAETGKSIWRTSLKLALSGGVGAGSDAVAVGTVQGDVILLDGQGKLRWQVASGGSEITAAPIISDNVVVARTGDGKLVAFGLADGKRKWSVERPLPPLTLYRASSALATRGAVFAGLPGGKLIAITLDQGKVGWEASVALPRGATELERVADVTGPPVAGAKDVCAATYQGRVACFDASNGNTLWSREASSVSGLGADTGQVYVADEKGVVYAWDRDSGAPSWKDEEYSGRRLIGATAAAGMVVTGDLQGYVHWLDRADGKTVARAATDGSSIGQQPLFLGDGVLVLTRKGGLYAFPMP